MFTVAAAAIATFTILYLIKHAPGRRSRRQSPNRIDLCNNHTCPICNE